MGEAKGLEDEFPKGRSVADDDEGISAGEMTAPSPDSPADYGDQVTSPGEISMNTCL